MTDSQKLFMYFAEAKAGASDDMPVEAGSSHALMIFASAANMVEGQEDAVWGAGEVGWENVRVVKAGEIKDGPDSIMEDALRLAAEDAVEHGLGLVVYDSELPPEGLQLTPTIQQGPNTPN